MSEYISALPAVKISELGLNARDLAELGGFSDKFARDILKGKCEIHDDVFEQVLKIDDDVEKITALLVSSVVEDQAVLYTFNTKQELRDQFPHWPERGNSAGGFCGPHRLALVGATDQLADKGVKFELVFFKRDVSTLDTAHKRNCP